MRFQALLSICAAIGMASPLLANFDVEVEPPTVWDPDINVLNDNLGIDPFCYGIETFESAINPCITVIVENATEAPEQRSGTGLEWDYDNVLTNWVSGFGDGNDVTFEFCEPVLRVGIGISHLRRLNTLYVNGVEIEADIRAFENFESSDTDRNGYIWITAGFGEVIETITFDEADPDRKDLILFDHLAWLPAPQADLTLVDPLPGVSNGFNTFRVNECTFGQKVSVWYGFEYGCSSIPGCGGVSLSINKVGKVGSAVADVDGIANITVKVPRTARGKTTYLQAHEQGTCYLSNVVIYTWP